MKSKSVSIVLVVLFLIFLTFMVVDYTRHPPLPESDPLSDRMGNTDNNLFAFGGFMLVELIVLLMLVRMSATKPIHLVLVVVVALGLITWSFMLSMHGGGVPVIHAVWTILATLTITLYIFASLRRRNKKESNT